MPCLRSHAAAFLLAFVGFTSPTWAGGSLSFEDRVRAQEAIERVYYAHRIWPKENPGPKPPFEQMMPKAQIESKVTDYLKKSAALGEFWQRPLTAEQLQAEMDRMVARTKDPETLKELFAALGNDPFLVAECLARPILADRLARNWYAFDSRFHGALKAEAEALRERLTPQNLRELGGERFHEVKIELEEPSSANRADEPDPGISKLERDDFVRVAAEFPSPGCLSGVEETGESFVVRWTKTRTEKALEGGIIVLEKTSFDVWFERSTRDLVAAEPVTGTTYVLNAPSSGVLSAEPTSPDSWKALWYVPDARLGHTAVWTGTEMIVWGGYDLRYYLNTGGRYTPSSDTWTATSTGDNTPSAREYHTAVWTGTEMIVWGGRGGSYFNTGGRYTPSSDTWTATSTAANCPSARYLHTAVWTGTQMVVWGGFGASVLNTGGRYTSSSDIWTATSIGANCPSARQAHTAVWTGTEMIVWGGDAGSFPFNTGGRYTPSSDTWTVTSTGANCPWARGSHTAVWTGTEMIVWGGGGTSGINTGGRYAPSSDTWAATSIGANCPSARRAHTAVWTGAEMIVWGGGVPSGFNTGGRYTPSSDTWTATSIGAYCPSARKYHTAVWTGTEMIVWGGSNDANYCINTAGRYTPSSDTWTATSTGTDFLSARYHHTAVWTGTEMIVWGGYDLRYYLNTGGRYTPSSDTWTATSTGANTPSAREYHTAVWTGTEMIVWGGNDGSGLNTGGRYTPSSDTWTATSTGANTPSARDYHTVVWTGTEMIVWGGRGGSYFNTGGRYTPSSDTWTATSTAANCPSARYLHTAVWTGTQMIVWGGYGGSQLNTGGRYAPSSDSWTAIPVSANCPSARYLHTAVWTGAEMIVWGGGIASYFNTGGRYTPSSDTWTATSIGANCPSVRYGHTAAWTGTEMIVWGGYGGSQLNTGGRYAPSSDTWTATPVSANCPSARYLHTAVWTGTEMIVWDGYFVTQTGGIFYPNTPPRSGPALVTSAGGDATYLLGMAETAQLDGSASTDGSNPSTSTPNHDELDSLVLYEWDLNGDALFGTQCATSSTGVDRTGATSAALSQADLSALGIATVGIHPIWLRVTDEVGERSCSSVDLHVRSVPCTAASSLTNNTAADVSDCEDTGVRITWSQDPGNWKDEGVGTRTYDLLRDGVPVATGLPYPTAAFVDTTGSNAVDYVYSVRYVNGCGLGAVTPGFVASDSVGNPGAASITGIVDAGVCVQNGVRVSFSPGPGATSHDLLRDGLPVVIGYASGAIYDPGDTTSHAYRVRAINGACSTDSVPQSASDQVDTPVPTITGPSPACASASLGTQAFSSYQWFQDGSLISGATSRNYSAVAPGSYTVRVTNANGCESTSVAFVVSTNPAPTVSGASTGCTSVSLSTGTFSSYQWIKDGADVGGATNQTYDATASGTYTVRVTNAQGCTGTSTGKAVTVGVSPSPTVSGPQVNSCPSTSVELQTGIYAAYQWFLGSLPIPRATSQTYEATVSANYKVRVTDGAGCTAESSAYAVFVDFCSTSEVSPDHAVFPLRLVEDPASSTGYYLYFQKLDSTTGYNGYIGTNGNWYSHGGMGVGRVCGQTTADLGTGQLRAEVAPPAGDRYFLVTSFDASSEGPSGFDANGLEVPSSLSTCSP